MTITTKGTKLTVHGTEVAIKSFPDMGAAPNYIECTTLSDDVQKFVEGVKPMAAMEFTANYDKTAFEALCAKEGTTGVYRLEFADGTYFTWAGKHKAIVVGGGVNAVLDMKLSVMPETEIKANEETTIEA